jgi:streptogramin lyase
MGPKRPFSKISPWVAVCFTFTSTVVAGPLSTIAGGKPGAPLPALKTGLTLFGVASGPLSSGLGDRTFVGGSHLVFELSGSALVRAAGCGVRGFAGDGGPALDAQLRDPTDLAIDGSGNLWIADAGNFRVRKVDAKTGLISTVAGSGVDGFPLEGAATDSPLGAIAAIAVSPSGDLWIADSTHFLLFLVPAGSGRIQRVAGTGEAGYDADGLLALQSRVGMILSMVADERGNLWMADATSFRVRYLDAFSGTLTTVAGGGGIEGVAADGGLATNAALLPVALARDGTGNLYLADALCSQGLARCPGCLIGACATKGPGSDLLRIVDGGLGLIKTVAGGGFPADGLGDGGSPRAAVFALTTRISISGSQLFLADALHRRLRAMDLNFTVIRTAAGNGAEAYAGDGGSPLEALLARPNDLALSPRGELWIADTGNDRVRVISADGQKIETAAGGGTPPDGIGDGLPAPLAALRSPRGVASDPLGNLWIADTGNQRVRLVEGILGAIVTRAGGIPAAIGRGDGGPAITAQLISPVDVLPGPLGEYWISDAGDARVRFADPAGFISTFAGGGLDFGDGAPATSAFLQEPGALAMDSIGNIYIVEEGASRVRAVDRATGLIRTVAGRASIILPELAGQALPDEILRPSGLALDAAGNLWVGDSAGHRLLQADPSSGRLSPIAGTGNEGYSPDGVPAHLAQLSSPTGILLEAQGTLLFAEGGNGLVRRMALTGLFLSIEPASGSLRGGYAAKITGQGLAGGAVRVFFGKTPALSLTPVDPGLLLVDVPPGTSPSSSVEVTVETSTDRAIVPGGFTYLNDPPVADPDPGEIDGGYFVAAGGVLTLDGTSSRDPNEAQGDAIVSFEWDLTGDGVPDFFGPRPVISALDFPRLGSPGRIPIRLRVTDSEGASSSTSTTITVVAVELSPNSGSLNGGYRGQVTGLGLAGVTGALFGVSSASGLVATETLVTFTIPPGPIPAGTVDVALELGGERLILSDAFTYINDPPVAVASPKGSYRLREGGSLVLDGTRSSDPNAPAGDLIQLFEWDLDGDGKFDRRGAKVLLTPDELSSFSILPGTSRLVTLQVTDLSGASATDSATISLEPDTRKFPNDDFAVWIGDRDANKIDDAIDAKPPNERVDLIVVLAEGSDLDAAAARLAPISSTPPAKIPAISALCLKGVRAADVRSTVASEPDLFRAESEVEIQADVDVSSAAIRARPSVLYSPDTAHDRNILGAGVNIAFLDSGIDDDHPALAGKFVAGFNAFTDSATGTGSQSNPDDDLEFAGIFHGTHVAGIALGSDPVYQGVAPAAKLIDVKILNNLGRGTTASFLQGLQWCINHKSYAWPGQPPANTGIDVVNLSVSSKERSDGKDVISMMVDAAVAQGLVVIASGGNNATFGPGFGAPGAADKAITVGATDDKGTIDRADDAISPTSNFGPRQDDGDSDLIEELKPDVVAPGVNIASPNGSSFGQPASGFSDLSGGSAASAHASGVAALVLQVEGSADPAAVKSLIRLGAEPRGTAFDPLLDPTYNARFGKGILDAFHSLPTDLGIANVVWVSHSGDDNVAAIVPDPSPTPSSAYRPGSPHSIGGGREPYGIAVDGTGSVWLANRLTANVTKLNSAGQVRFVVPLAALLGAQPNADLGGIATDSENEAWVTLTSSNRVVQIHADGGVDLASHPVGTAPVAVATDRFGNVWVANSGSNDVTKLDSTGAEASGSPFAAGSLPSAIVCDRAGRAYIANHDSNDVTILEPNGSLNGNFPAGVNPVEIAIDFAGDVWVSNDLQATVTKVTSGGGLAVNVGAGPRGISVAGDGTLWVSLYTVGIGSTVTRVRPDGTVLEFLRIGFAPINHGDGTGFVHANSVDPNGDADGDGWSNATEIDGSTNPFDRTQHPVVITAMVPPQGSVNGGNVARIEGQGLELPVAIELDGQPAIVFGTFPGGVNVLVPQGVFPPGPSVEVMASRPEGTSFTLPGGYRYLNDPPVPDPDPDNPDDGYTILLGSSLTLDGSSSSDPDSSLGDSIVRYEWSLNGHVVLGANPTLSPATLTSFGMGSSGVFPLSLTVEDSLGATASSFSVVRVVDALSPQFRRGNSNQDGTIDLSDVIFTINWLFLGGTTPKCLEAANSNSDSRLDIADAIYGINYLFLGGPPPGPPFPACGPGVQVFGCVLSNCP